MISEEYIQELVRRKLEGESYSSIRKDLENKQLDESKVRELIRYIDDAVLKQETDKAKRIRAGEIKTIGIIVAAAGVVITLGSILGLINTGGYIIITYGPLLSGLGLWGYGDISRQRKTGKIRRFN